MESAESQVSLDPPEQLIPQHQNNIQESETDKRLRVLLEAHRDNGHLQSFLEAYQHDEDLRDLLEAIQSDEDLVALVKAYRENKHIRTIIHHQPASEPIDDYITEFETRCQLFAKFQECTDSTNFLARKRALNATVFAIVMVAPIAILQTTLSSPKNRDKWLINYFGMVQDRAAEVVKYYKPGCQVTIQWVLEGFLRRPIVIPSQAENSLAANKCQARDNYSCIFTGMSNPAEAYIFPSTRSSSNFHYLVSLLLTFWGEESEMRSYLMKFDDAHFPKRVENLLCLNRQLQHWWYDARFALKPLRKEGNKIIVQWHWLIGTRLQPKQLIAKGDNLSSFVDPIGWGDDDEGVFAHHESGRNIETGHTFFIGGGNPEHLPAFELLELQWFLARIAAISGSDKSWKMGA